MWLDKILDAKKTQNITVKMMTAKCCLPEETITRILTRKTKNPRIDTILSLGASVGLSALELFAETTLVVSDKNLETLQDEIELLKVDYERVLSENAVLADKNATLKEKIEILKDELIATHNYYIKMRSTE